MKKEVLLAIIVGFSLGLVITYGIYRAQQSIQNVVSDNQNQQSDDSSDKMSHVLTVTQPNDGDIVDDDQLTVAGVTTPNALVAVMTRDDQAVVSADKFGNFTSQVEVSAGANELLVSSYDKDGNQASTEIAVVFSTVDLGDETDELEEEE